MNNEVKTSLRTYKNFCSHKCLDKQRQIKIKEEAKKFKDKYKVSKYQLLGLTRKLDLIDIFGGKCEICGYNKNLSALEFHHINESSKEFELTTSTLRGKSEEEILNEALKCKLLCSNCHREIHSPEKDVDLLRKIKIIINLKKDLLS